MVNDADFIITTNAPEVAEALARAADLAPAQVRRLVGHHTALLQTRVKGRASGRPGPRAVTGDYRRSVGRQVFVLDGGREVVGLVGTNAPQGRRLEFGFTGVDSLGRFYDQPPYPHFGPALDDTAPEFYGALNAALDEFARKGSW